MGVKRWFFPLKNVASKAVRRQVAFFMNPPSILFTFISISQNPEGIANLKPLLGRI
jgi:hypothetical protein